jgi:hypothetical protein
LLQLQGITNSNNTNFANVAYLADFGHKAAGLQGPVSDPLLSPQLRRLTEDYQPLLLPEADIVLANCQR